MMKCSWREEEWDTWAQNTIEMPQAKVWGVKFPAPLTDTMSFIHTDLINSFQELLIKPQMHEARINWQLRGQYDSTKLQWMDLLYLITQRIGIPLIIRVAFIKFGLSPRSSAITDMAHQPCHTNYSASWIPSDQSSNSLYLKWKGLSNGIYHTMTQRTERVKIGKQKPSKFNFWVSSPSIGMDMNVPSFWS